MKIISVKELAFPAIKVIRFGRFRDHRGYFTEHLRRSDLHTHPLLAFLKRVEFTQTNESYSKAGTVRGMHFQFNPYVGKLVRTVEGHLIDLVLDIRKGSPTFGQIIAYDMPSKRGDEFNEWIWIPPGFAHGTLLVEDTAIEYYCTGEYNPQGEAGISPLAADIDWLLCDRPLREAFQRIAPHTPFITDKDRHGFSVAAWAKDERSNHFIYNQDE